MKNKIDYFYKLYKIKCTDHLLCNTECTQSKYAKDCPDGWNNGLTDSITLGLVDFLLGYFDRVNFSDNRIYCTAVYEGSWDNDYDSDSYCSREFENLEDRLLDIFCVIHPLLSEEDVLLVDSLFCMGD